MLKHVNVSNKGLRQIIVITIFLPVVQYRKVILYIRTNECDKQPVMMNYTVILTGAGEVKWLCLTLNEMNILEIEDLIGVEK